jgi:hypothetical protein
MLINCALLFNGCDTAIKNAKQESNSHNQDYDIDIKYIYNHKYDSLRCWDDTKFPKDSLYIISEFYFTDTHINLPIPDSLVFTFVKNNRDIIKKRYTKASLEEGYNEFTCGALNNFKSIGIRINNGNLAFVEIDSTKHIMRVEYDAIEKKLTVDFLNKMPKYR